LEDVPQGSPQNPDWSFRTQELHDDGCCGSLEASLKVDSMRFGEAPCNVLDYLRATQIIVPASRARVKEDFPHKFAVRAVEPRVTDLQPVEIPRVRVALADFDPVTKLVPQLRGADVPNEGTQRGPNRFDHLTKRQYSAAPKLGWIYNPSPVKVEGACRMYCFKVSAKIVRDFPRHLTVRIF
jgi:hypothetical protein